MKRALLIAALGTCPLLGLSQDWFAVASLTYSTNSMTELRKLQEQYSYFIGIPTKVLTSFPPYWGWSVEGGRTFGSKFSAGISVNYTSTGGRVYYEDYSGSTSLDQVLTAYSLAPYFQVRVNHSTEWPLHVSLGVSWVITNMTVMNLTTLTAGQSSRYETEFYSNNFGLKPALIVRRQLGPVFAQASLGYELQLAGKLYLDGSDEQYIISANGDVVTAQWSGLRASLGIGMMLNSKVREENKQ